VIQHQESVSAVHKVKNVSLISLCRHFDVPLLNELEKHKSKRDQRFWTKRPMEADAMYLAALEVHILAAVLYPKLSK